VYSNIQNGIIFFTALKGHYFKNSMYRYDNWTPKPTKTKLKATQDRKKNSAYSDNTKGSAVIFGLTKL
jgi:hypothetical protein